MNTRREMAIALLGLPLAAHAVQPELTGTPSLKHTLKQVPPPFSETAARIISYTLYAEARGESLDGKIAVAAVIKTRSIRTKVSLAETCMQDRQFSCWNELVAVPEFYITGEGILPDDLWARTECYGVAWMLMTSDRKWDYLTHFYNPAKATPKWAQDLKGRRTIGRHVFGYID